MQDYSDLVYLIAAMVLFALLTLNVSRTLVLNSQDLAENEVEREGVDVAQSFIEQAKWISTESNLQALDTNNNPVTRTVEGIDYNVLVNVRDTSISGTVTTDKVLDVRVGSQYLNSSSPYPIKMKYIKTF